MNPEPPTAETKETEVKTPAAQLFDLSQHWKWDADLMCCKKCKRNIHVSRVDEAMVHAAGCTNTEWYPWRVFRAALGGNGKEILDSSNPETQARIVMLHKQVNLLRSMLADERNHSQHVVDQMNAIAKAKPENRNAIWGDLVSLSRSRLIWPSKMPPPVVSREEHEEVVKERDQANGEIAALKGQLREASTSFDIVEKLRTAAVAEAGLLHQRNEDAKAALLVECERRAKAEAIVEAANADAESLAVNLAEVAAQLRDCKHPACTNCDRVKEAQKALAAHEARKALAGTAEADKSVRAPVPAVEWHNPNGTSFERLGERHRFLVPEEVDGRFGQYQTPRAEYYVTDQKKWVPADTADAATITYRVPISTPLPDGRVVGIHVSRETGKEEGV